jgi:hypothetical protein
MLYRITPPQSAPFLFLLLKPQAYKKPTMWNMWPKEVLVVLVLSLHGDIMRHSHSQYSHELETLAGG